MVAALALLGASRAGATTYYVAKTGSDSANGSLSTPWLTISRAVGVAVAGDTVIVEDGTYVETVNWSHSGSSGSPITFRSQNKWGAHIAPTSAQINSNLALTTQVESTGDYTIIQDFDISGAGDGDSPSNAGIKIQVGADNCKVLGNKIHDIGYASTRCPIGAAINIAANGAVVDKNYICHCAPPRSAGFLCRTGGHGMYFNGPSINGTFTNNLLADIAQGFGIQWDSRSAPITGFVVDNNTFTNLGDSGHKTGGAIYYPCTATGCGMNKFNNNIIANVQNQTMLLDPGGTGYGSLGADQIFNSVIYSSPAVNFNGSDEPTSILQNTVTSNPLFVNYTGDQTGNYHLQATSPAINAGTSSGAPNHDFDENTRPQGAAYDIGALEFLASLPAAPTNLTATPH